MARDFPTSAFFSSSSPPVTAAPFTMACWFNADNLAVRNIIQSLGDVTSGTSYWAMSADGLGAGDPFGVFIEQGGQLFVSSGVAFSAGVWHHGCFVEASATDHRAFLDGTKGTDATSKAPATTNTYRIGRIVHNSSSQNMDGRIAWATVWDVALTDAEVASLAARVHPFQVRPQNIVSFVPIWGVTSPEPDFVSGGSMTPTGTATKADSIPLIQPVYRPGLVAASAAASPALVAAGGWW